MMNMNFSGPVFLILFSALLLLNLVRFRQRQLFFTVHVFFRKFTILDLEFPSSERELSDYLEGISDLPVDVARKITRALKGYLYLNFLYFPVLYLNISMTCMFVAGLMGFYGHFLLVILAWSQVFPLICGIIETFYLLFRLKNPLPAKKAANAAEYKNPSYRLISWLLRIKYGFSLLALVTCVSTFAYLFVSGNLNLVNLQFVVILLSLLILFFALIKIFSNMQRLNAEPLQNITN